MRRSLSAAGSLNRLVCAALFLVAGTLHFLFPKPYRAIIPDYLPAPDLLVAVSGAAEIAGGAGLLLRSTRRAAGVGLILLLIAVFPANIEAVRLLRARGVSGWLEALAWMRLPLQAVLIWWVERVSRTPPQK